MSPQEKAKELVGKFFSVQNGIGIERIYRSEAIQCAIIAVNELIDCTYSEIDVVGEMGIDSVYSIKKYTFEFWQKVKSEIEKL